MPLLVSGAGHDALAMAELTPIGMLFVRCRHGGISHSPEVRSPVFGVWVRVRVRVEGRGRGWGRGRGQGQGQG